MEALESLFALFFRVQRKSKDFFLVAFSLL